ncbi:MAG: hypothetical protein AAGN66_00625 [Acidobacteriota bacterium]
MKPYFRLRNGFVALLIVGLAAPVAAQGPDGSRPGSVVIPPDLVPKMDGVVQVFLDLRHTAPRDWRQRVLEPLGISDRSSAASRVLLRFADTWDRRPNSVDPRIDAGWFGQRYCALLAELRAVDFPAEVLEARVEARRSGSSPVTDDLDRAVEVIEISQEAFDGACREVG